MKTRLPGYYTSLGPFEAVFDQGNPILTYHKLGHRPRRVRLRGLYLGVGLFRRQLEELRASGFTSASLADCAAPRAGRRIVITFDDGYVNVLQHALGLLAQTGFKAVQFLTADLLGKSNEWDVPLGESPERLMDAVQARDWLAAGHAIGSHTLTHPWLTKLPRDQAREEISASKRKLEDLFGRAIEHFCYPYGDWNAAVRDLVVEAGYRTACTTEFGVNTSATDRYGLKRITARYQSLRPATVFEWLRFKVTAHG